MMHYLSHIKYLNILEFIPGLQVIDMSVDTYIKGFKISLAL